MSNVNLEFEIIPVTAFAQNCTFFWCNDTKQGAVREPARDIEKIIAAIDKQQLNLVKILLTHAHPDHADATAALAKKYGVIIEGPHKENKFWIYMIEQQKQMFGQSFCSAQAFKPDRLLQQGDTVTFGNIELEVYVCPGHTSGHVVFFHRASKLAQVGVLLFSSSIGRADFPRGDHATLVNSIRHNFFPLGDDICFIPGHIPMSNFGQEHHSNPHVSDSTHGINRVRN